MFIKKKNKTYYLFIFRNRFKLSNLIAPLLNNQAEQKIAETESISVNNNTN